MKWTAALLLALAGTAQAQNPRVLLDTDRGPIVLELNQERAPLSVANFLRYVDAGDYNTTLFHRLSRQNTSGVSVIQAGQFREDGTNIASRGAIASERTNGLANDRGTLAAVLSSSGGAPNFSSAANGFYINSSANSTLNGSFTVFGRVLQGLSVVDAIKAAPLFPSPSEQPIRYPYIKSAKRVSGFPILDLHSGAWFDPAKAGRGFSVEIAGDPANAANRLIVVYWYDYSEGRQIWMNGASSFAYGASSVTLPMQITSGGQFGAAYDPASVTSNTSWGSLTVSFTGCAAAQFSYTSSFGNGSATLQRLTQPAGTVCD